MKKILLPLMAAAFMAFPAEAQQTKILTAEKFNEYGLVYSLPTTALQITVTGRREVYTPGPYKDYAKRYLGKADVITEEKVKSYVTDVKVTAVGVKDDDTQYLMQLKAGATTFIGVASDGMLLSINTEPLYPVMTETPVQTGIKIVSSTGDVSDYLKYVDMDFVSAQNSMRQAEMIANSLMDVRDSYLSLTRGTADNTPADGRQLELMLNSLKEQEDALTRAFAGSVKVEEFTAQYTFIPEEEGEQVLCRLSNFTGFVDAEDYSGTPVYIRTEVLKEGILPLDANGEQKKFPKDGVVYAIPGTAKITLYTDNAHLFGKEYELPQFGTRFALAPGLFTDKKAPSYARFDPVTGALLEIGTVNSKD